MSRTVKRRLGRKVDLATAKASLEAALVHIRAAECATNPFPAAVSGLHLMDALAEIVVAEREIVRAAHLDFAEIRHSEPDQ